jgi:hypothetical protein
MLVERRLLSRRQLELALVEQHRTGRRLGEVLVGFGFVSEQALAAVLLEQVGLMDPKPRPQPAPEPKRAGHLAEAEPEPERPVVKRVEDMPARREPPEGAQSLEAQVAEFERRSEAIQHSIAEIRGVLAELKAS